MDFKIATINIKHPLRNTKEVSNSTKPIAKSLHVGMLSRKFRDAVSGVFSKRLSWHPPRLQHFKTLLSICGNKRKVWDLKRTKSSLVMDHFSFLTAILHCGLRNDFFFHYVHLLSIFYLDCYFPFSFVLLFPFPIWPFISLFSLDFYFPFLIGLLFPFFIWTFISLFSLDFLYS